MYRIVDGVLLLVYLTFWMSDREEMEVKSDDRGDRLVVKRNPVFAQ